MAPLWPGSPWTFWFYLVFCWDDCWEKDVITHWASLNSTRTNITRFPTWALHEALWHISLGFAPHIIPPYYQFIINVGMWPANSWNFTAYLVSVVTGLDDLMWKHERIFSSVRHYQLATTVLTCIFDFLVLLTVFLQPPKQDGVLAPTITFHQRAV